MTELILSIVTGLLSSTTLGGIYLTVKYRNQNKKLKDLEVKKTEIETQSSSLDIEEKKMSLADSYLEKMQKAADVIFESAQKTMDSGLEVQSALRELSTRCQSIEDSQKESMKKHKDLALLVETIFIKVNALEMFGNGEYKKFVQEHQSEITKTQVKM